MTAFLVFVVSLPGLAAGLCLGLSFAFTPAAIAGGDFILRQIRRERRTLPGYSIVVNAHPAVIDLLQSEEKASIKEVESKYMRRLKLVPRKEYHIEQFDLQGA